LFVVGLNNNSVIHEVPSPENEDSIADMCKQLTMGLASLSENPFATAQGAPGGSPRHGAGATAGHMAPMLIKQHSMPATFHTTQPGMLSAFWHFMIIIYIKKGKSSKKKIF